MDLGQKVTDSGAERVRRPAPEGLAGRKIALLLMLNDMTPDRRHALDDDLLEMLLEDPDCFEWLSENRHALG